LVVVAAEGELMQFVHPEAFLLLPLAALVLRDRLWPRPSLGVLRVILLIALTAVLAQPSWGAVEDGRDVVLVVDRSRSMPVGHLQQVRELADEITGDLPAGDRIGVVTFGREAFVVSHLAPTLNWSEELRSLDPDGSSLGAALTTALALIEPGRNATLLVWSDGEVSTEQAESLARLASRRGIRIDVRPVVRDFGRDAAVYEMRVPAEVPVESPFAINATVVVTESSTAEWRLLVGGERVRSGSVSLQAGRNTLQLQHRLLTPGEQAVALEVVMPGDTTPQNNRGVAVLRGTAKTRVLCVTPAGREDRLTKSLRAVGIDIVVVSPELAPLTTSELDGFRAVVLEDVPASQLPARAMRNISNWVRNLGGGLLMTGGFNSFGVGGYHMSELEDVLPVTMEIREEQRKFGLAMAIALDRSGSMQATVGDTTKMQLANRGAATAIELMSAMDAVSVLAVDTRPHVVQPLEVVEDLEGILARVRSIESSGGGIYIGEALHAAAKQLDGATQQNRHIVIFADANDSEQPEDYKEFLPELVANGITVSVIGLGTPSDSDAQLLEEVAFLGKGRCQFVELATDLPRVFAAETIQVARSSLIEEQTSVDVEPSLQLLGAMPEDMPAVGGYTVAWMRDRAERDLSARPGPDAAGEEIEPMLAHWQIGLGRSAAFLGEADGVLTGEWAQWSGYADFFGTLVRWLCGGAPAGLFVDAHRDGDVAVYHLEVDQDNARVLDTVRGVVTLPSGEVEALVFESVSAGRVAIRVPLMSEGVYRAAVQIGSETVRLPPMCLPYSSEWTLQLDPQRGEHTLRGLARRTHGNVAPSVATLLEGPRKSLGRTDFSSWLLLLALVALVSEVAVRRLQVHVPNYASKWAEARAQKVASKRARQQLAKRAAAVPANQPAGVVAGGEDVEEVEPGGAAKAKESSDSLLSALERAQRRGRV
jgi:uncharacterized membrane protein